MTITHYIGGKLTGVTADFPPSLNYPELTTFINFETSVEYILVAGVWQQIGIPPVVGQGGWKELVRETLGSPASSITAVVPSTKRYYMILGHNFNNAGFADYRLRLNGDSGSNYGARFSENGAESGLSNQNRMTYSSQNTVQEHFSVAYLTGFTTEEKEVVGYSVQGGGSGASNAPNRDILTGKHAQATNPVTSITHVAADGGTYGTGSEMVVLEWSPEDTHVDGFWEEIGSETLATPETKPQVLFTPKKYLWIQIYFPSISGIPSNIQYTFDDVSAGSLYSNRNSSNGLADSLAVSQNRGQIIPFDTNAMFINMFVINNANQEKLVTALTISQMASGQTTAPQRTEHASKYAQTTSQVGSLELTLDGASTFPAGTRFKVWGHD